MDFIFYIMWRIALESDYCRKKQSKMRWKINSADIRIQTHICINFVKPIFNHPHRSQLLH